MTREVRNLRGEIVPDTDPDKRWWHFDSSTWLLIGGLALFNIGCFFNPNLIDSIFRMLDVRLWPWSYCLILGVIVLFSIRWFLIYSRCEDYDGTEADAAMRFVRLSIFMTAVMVFWILLHATRLLFHLYYPLSEWLGRGAFSWVAVLAFVLLLGIIAAFVHFFKEWIVIFWKR